MKRHLKHVMLSGAVLLMTSVVWCANATGEKSGKPNIIVVLTDDQRWDAAGYSNPGNFLTPGLDKLCERSMNFTRAYAAFALCSPSRAAILTGQYGSRNGVTELGGQVSRPEESFAHILRQDGYETAVCGKWHLQNTPEELGFGWAVTFFGNGTWHGRAVNRHGVTVKPKELVDRYCAGESVRFLRDRDKSRPFFLLHCTQLPHMDHRHQWPATQASLERYDQKEMLLPPTWKGDEDGKPDWLKEARNRTQAVTYGYDKDPNSIRSHIKAYRATVTDMDDALARLWKELDVQNLWDNTIVVFTSDNGWMLGEHGLTSKVLAYEPSARIPMLMAIPGMAGGRSCERLVSNLDLAPTLLEFAGLPVPVRCQGRSLRPLLADPGATFRKGFVYEGLGGYGGVPPMGAWITERMKFIHTWKNGESAKPVYTECYDLEKDPDEASNLQLTDFVEEWRVAASELRAHLEAAGKQAEQTGEQVVAPNRSIAPTLKSTPPIRGPED